MSPGSVRSAARPGPPGTHTSIVQEYVDHDAELRVYYIDGRVRGFEVGKEAAADPWLAPDLVTVRAASLSEAVVSATRMLAQGLSLRYGAFDFLLRDDGPVFLEVNPDGDWLWAETKAKTASVTLAVGQMLCELHRRYRPSPAPSGGVGRPDADGLRPSIVPRPADGAARSRLIGALAPISADRHGRDRDGGVPHDDGAACPVDHRPEPAEQLRQDGRRELAVGAKGGNDREPLRPRVRP